MTISFFQHTPIENVNSSIRVERHLLACYSNVPPDTSRTKEQSTMCSNVNMHRNDSVKPRSVAMKIELLEKVKTLYDTLQQSFIFLGRTSCQ